MGEFKPIRTTSTNLSSVSVVDGQLIITTDTGGIYVDSGNTRVQIGIAVNQGSGNSGKYLTINSSGVVINTSFPVASTAVIGGIKVDGTVTTVNASNQLQINRNSLVAGTNTNSIALGNNVSQYGCGNSSIAIGNGPSAMAASDIAIGTEAYAFSGIAIGYNSYAEGSSGTSTGIAIGYNATANNGGIQIGSGTASGTSFSVNSYQMLNLNTGLIPYQRLPYASSSNVGAVKVDNSTIKVDVNGKISASDQLSSIKISANAGKFLKIDSNGNIVVESLPVYNGAVS